MNSYFKKSQIRFWVPAALMIVFWIVTSLFLCRKGGDIYGASSSFLILLFSIFPVSCCFFTRCNLKKVEELECSELSVLRERDKHLDNLEMIQATANVGMWHADLNTREIFFSGEMKRIHGMTGPENIFLLDDLIQEYVYPKDREMIGQLYLGSVRGDIKSDFIFRIIRRDGEIRWLRVSTKVPEDLHEEKKRASISGTVQDITTVRNVEASLQESELRYRRIVEMSPNMVMIHRKGRILYINNAGCSLMGAENKSMVIGRKIHEFVVPENRNIMGERVRLLQQEGGISPVYEQKIKTIQGKVIDIDICGIEFNYEGGSAIQVIARDITEHKRADLELRMLNEELEQRIENRTGELVSANKRLVSEMEKKKQLQSRLIISERLAATGLLASSIAHEINSPLQGIVSLLDYMKKSNPEDEELIENLDLLRAAFRSIKNTVKNLLDLNRPIKEPLQMDNVNRIVEKTVTILKSHIRKNNVEVVLDLDQDLPDLLVSSQQLSQCILNIVNNSVEAFMEREVDLVQTLEGLPPGGTICIRSYEHGDMARLSISDDGPGVPDKDLDHIFDAFYTSKIGKGMGMGLAVCLEIMEYHGGRIFASRGPVGGAEFTMEIPKKRSSAEPGG